MAIIKYNNANTMFPPAESPDKIIFLIFKFNSLLACFNIQL